MSGDTHGKVVQPLESEARLRGKGLLLHPRLRFISAALLVLLAVSQIVALRVEVAHLRSRVGDDPRIGQRRSPVRRPVSRYAAPSLTETMDDFDGRVSDLEQRVEESETVLQELESRIDNVESGR